MSKWPAKLFNENGGCLKQCPWDCLSQSLPFITYDWSDLIASFDYGLNRTKISKRACMHLVILKYCLPNTNETGTDYIILCITAPSGINRNTSQLLEQRDCSLHVQTQNLSYSAAKISLVLSGSSSIQTVKFEATLQKELEVVGRRTKGLAQQKRCKNEILKRDSCDDVQAKEQLTTWRRQVICQSTQKVASQL